MMPPLLQVVYRDLDAFGRLPADWLAVDYQEGEILSTQCKAIQ